MPHRCTNCGKEYKEASFAVLHGCEQCGGKKFLYTRAGKATGPVIEEAGSPKDEPRRPLASVTGAEGEQSTPDKPGKPSYDKEGQRVESVRIISPGTYELNIAKMAESDERVVATGGDGSYMVDLISMMKPRSKRKREK